MADFESKSLVIPRPEHIHISGRHCCRCRQNVQRAIVFRFAGAVQLDINLCDPCTKACLVDLRMGNDSVFVIGIDRR